MLRVYQYFLFRIYHFYVNVFKEKDLPVFYTGAISTLFLYFTLILVYGFFELVGFVPVNKSSYLFTVLTIFAVWLLNYFLFVRQEEFLKKNFKNDLLGGILVVAYLVLLLTLLIIQGKISRGEL